MNGSGGRKEGRRERETMPRRTEGPNCATYGEQQAKKALRRAQALDTLEE